MHHKHVTLSTFKYKIWCDDDCLGLGVYLKVSESIVEYARRKNDGAQIKVAELEVAQKNNKPSFEIENASYTNEH